MLEQFLTFGVDIRTDAHGGRPDGPPHHGRPPDHARVRRPPSRDSSPAAKCSGGVHGANRLGGNALAETQVFGRRAGLSAGTSPEAGEGRDARDRAAARRAPAAVRRLPRRRGPARVGRAPPQADDVGRRRDLPDRGRACDRPLPGSRCSGTSGCRPSPSATCRVLHCREHVPHGVAHLPVRPPPGRVPRGPHAPRSQLRCRRTDRRSATPSSRSRAGDRGGRPDDRRHDPGLAVRPGIGRTGAARAVHGRGQRRGPGPPRAPRHPRTRTRPSPTATPAARASAARARCG